MSKEPGALQALPNGLHFTPSMSARALLNGLHIIEIPMPYDDRVGTSKLSVVRDGVRFLRTIVDGVLGYRPERVMLFLLGVSVAAILIMGASPTEYYLQYRRLEDWMIYRFVVCGLLASFGLTLVLATALIAQMSDLGPRRAGTASFWPSIVANVMRVPVVSGLFLALLGVAGFFLWPGVVEYATSGGTTLHWSRLLAGAFCILAAFQAAVFGVMFAVVSLWADYVEPR